MHKYKIIDHTQIPADVRQACQRALAYARRELSLGPIIIDWFVPADAAGYTACTGSKIFTSEDDIRGQMSAIRSDRIRVRGDIGMPAVETTLHEIAHVYEYMVPDGHLVPDEEREEFAQLWAAGHLQAALSCDDETYLAHLCDIENFGKPRLTRYGNLLRQQLDQLEKDVEDYAKKVAAGKAGRPRIPQPSERHSWLDDCVDPELKELIIEDEKRQKRMVREMGKRAYRDVIGNLLNAYKQMGSAILLKSTIAAKSHCGMACVGWDWSQGCHEGGKRCANSRVVKFTLERARDELARAKAWRY
ncbi:MAG: hypothetical protein IBX64_14025 [Actinobacteria bacterium]|nr:hypothetical protein [Actinomycetota bacterium]